MSRYRRPDFSVPTVKIPLQPPGLDNVFTRLVRRAEAAGFERIWNFESTDREAFAQATLLALGSSTITIGTDIASFFSHTPTLLAMGALTLHEISGGRFILGIGPGGTQIISDGHGIPFEKPVKRARETVQIIRSLLSGERFNFEGEIFNIRRDFRLRLKPNGRGIPIYISGINPRMLQLAGELADGVILTHAPIEAIKDVKENVAIGAARAGRDPAEVLMLSNLPVGVNDEEAIFALKRSLCLYLASETFDWFVSHTEWGELRARIKSLWWENRRDEAATLADDRFVETFGLGFKDDVIQARILKYLEAGVVPILYPYGVRDGHEEDDLNHLLDRGAEATR
ncbi:MAG TPA: LLM class flavin-dependent oxidoreductase [Candidatus Limnocylindrales bacterium]|nr:LLM class flavin-dependent oxidoreductase [Candidatus Limnocylindrales bacterium]